MRTFLLSFLIIWMHPLQAQTLEFHFIGNMAYEISDGETTLLSDFPYESGAFGYMTYKFEDGSDITRITHRSGLDG